MSLRQTAFHSRTAALGATFVEYAGYDFPSQFAADITDEYWACRRRAVVMDLTPLRKVEVTGPGAEAVLQATVTRDLRRLGDGQVVYTGLCDEDGNLLDDGTVFRFGPERFRWVGYTDEDEAWFRRHAERLRLRGVARELHGSAAQHRSPGPGEPRHRDLGGPDARIGHDGGRPDVVPFHRGPDRRRGRADGGRVADRLLGRARL